MDAFEMIYNPNRNRNRNRNHNRNCNSNRNRNLNHNRNRNHKRLLGQKKRKYLIFKESSPYKFTYGVCMGDRDEYHIVF
ncbi:hypothetical protein BCR32DRAFT_276178 [Anaeromyces robustus]|uniref:Uncharacterized protein n=1 Tax=Anaeromyces robustus TaxID=1754192 RepID=A0A1Y1XJG9_9FUNG|nr:hypothetical protein BCR32DRAFT_276178 [Anaeromyces robustus]|eukprot:ORX85514.1 hypothetical protein BCR32DRAFT_276178 [Anaeromyces robustus]